MGMLDYIKDNWRDAYSPFQRYPEIYDEHYKQGMGMLTTDAPGAWDIATKPMGALMMSGIPSLYEAFRDEPIYNTLVNDLNIDKTKADYATQAIGLGLDVGVPWAVMKKGMTPWISEQVAKQANPSGFSPSRRRFLKGTGAAVAGTAAGIPMLKQVAKKAPDFFADLATNVAGSLKNVTTEKALLSGYGSKFEPALNVLGRLRRMYVDKRYLDKKHIPNRGWSNITPGGVDADKVVSGLSDRIGHLAVRGNEQLDDYIDDIYFNLNDLQPVSDLYKSNPKEFISFLNKDIKWLESKAEKPNGAKWEAELKAAKDMLKRLN